MIVAVNVTFDCAGTATLGELNATDASDVKKPGANVLPPVESAFTYERSYVTAFLLRFQISIVLAAGPDSLSPRASLPGETSVWARIESSMSTIPAPCRWTLSRKPRLGFPNHGAGSALFWRMVRTLSGFVFGFACSSSAAAPATCGEAIEVPLIVAYAPSSSGYVDRMRPPGAPMSGLRSSSASSPYELNDEMRPPVGFVNEPVSSVQLSVCGPASIALLIDTPSVSETATTGIVTGFPSAPAATATVGLKRPGTLL